MHPYHNWPWPVCSTAAGVPACTHCGSGRAPQVDKETVLREWQSLWINHCPEACVVCEAGGAKLGGAALARPALALELCLAEAPVGGNA